MLIILDQKSCSFEVRKKGRQKLATSFATLMLNELKSNVALFTTQIKPTLLRGGSRGRVQGVPPLPKVTCGFLIQLVFCKKKKKKKKWFIGVEVEQETSAPPPLLNQIRLLSLPGRLCCCKTSLSWASNTNNMYRFC